MEWKARVQKRKTIPEMNINNDYCDVTRMCDRQADGQTDVEVEIVI